MARGGWPVVGREAELAAVASFLRAPLTSSAALVIEGEAGIGKSTIVRVALERAAGAGLLVLAARLSASESALPYVALGDLLAVVDDDALSALARPQRDAIAVALGKADGSVDSAALSRGLLELLRACSAGGDLLLAFDDVQWIDRPTASAVTFALRRLGASRLRVLLAVRTGEEVPGELLGVAEWESVRRLVIGPMSATELGALLGEHLGGRLPRPRLEAIHRASGGNPMFALELARPGRGEWPAGTTLTGEVSARLRTLDAGARTALSFAAVALRPSTDLILAAGVNRDDLRAALESGVLRVEGEHLTFAHPLLGAAADGLLLPDERRRIHARLAAASEDAVERGHHLSWSAGGRDESAALALDRAAEAASGLGDHAAAAAFLLRAAELSLDAEGEHARIREVEAAAELLLAGDLKAAAGLARRLVERLPTGVARARARATLTNCLVGEEMSYEENLAELQLALVDAAADDATSAALHVELAETTAGMFRLEQSLQHSRAAIALAEQAGQTAIQATALGLIGLVESLLGRGVTEAARRAYAIWDGTTLSVASYSPRMSLAEVCLYASDFAEAERLYLEELAMAEERGLEVIEVIARAHLAETQLRAGDWAAALANARLAHEHARQAADDQIVVGTAYALGMIEALLGDLVAARARASSTLAAAEATGDFWHTMFSRSVLGLAALTERDHEVTVDVLTPAWSAITESELGDLSVFPVGHVLGEALVAIDRLDEAVAVVEALRVCPARERPWCRAMAGRVDALVASARGDHAAAREHVAAALAAHAELPEPFEHARTVYILGRVERRARSWGTARAALVDALGRFDQLGAALWAEHVAADIAALPGRRPVSDRGLTAREREIAELVASGLSNKEVAARLFVSVRTVEANLSKLYAKLGVRTRTELANVIR